jgi:hypothetical protein
VLLGVVLVSARPTAAATSAFAFLLCSATAAAPAFLLRSELLVGPLEGFFFGPKVPPEPVLPEDEVLSSDEVLVRGLLRGLLKGERLPSPSSAPTRAPSLPGFLRPPGLGGGSRTDVEFGFLVLLLAVPPGRDELRGGIAGAGVGYSLCKAFKLF